MNADTLFAAYPHCVHSVSFCELHLDPEMWACDHISLQLWCLAGPDRWPVCDHFSTDALTATAR
jgi:hypothetical protein